jgi:hypothetical protein
LRRYDADRDRCCVALRSEYFFRTERLAVLSPMDSEDLREAAPAPGRASRAGRASRVSRVFALPFQRPRSIAVATPPIEAP